jgi:uncharacterized lipoprotein YehR (DUF1307 family)
MQQNCWATRMFPSLFSFICITVLTVCEERLSTTDIALKKKDIKITNVYSEVVQTQWNMRDMVVGTVNIETVEQADEMKRNVFSPSAASSPLEHRLGLHFTCHWP